MRVDRQPLCDLTRIRIAHLRSTQPATQTAKQIHTNSYPEQNDPAAEPTPMSRYPARDEFPKMTRDPILSMLTPIIIPHTYHQRVNVGLFSRSSLHPSWTEACFQLYDILDDTPVSIFRLLIFRADACVIFSFFQIS